MNEHLQELKCGGRHMTKLELLQKELEIMVKDDERSQETIIRLSKENKELKERINKAIEYINKTTNNTMFELRSDTGELNYLMRILKGDE